MNKPRLIDANELIKYTEEQPGEIIDSGDIAYFPTAYDIDKVVEQLKKESWSLGSDDVIEHYCVDLLDAIEIVKGGMNNE